MSSGSRVARSNIVTFHQMGAKVTRVSWPTLMPRGIKSLGWEDRFSRWTGSRRPTSFTRLRMPGGRIVVASSRSFRGFAAWFMVNGARLTPRQVLVRPGPVNPPASSSLRKVVDSPWGIITAQVAAGVVERIAVLFQLHPVARGLPPRRRIERVLRLSSSSQPAPARMMPAQPLIRGQLAAADLLLHDVHVLDPRGRA